MQDVWYLFINKKDNWFIALHRRTSRSLRVDGIQEEKKREKCLHKMIRDYKMLSVMNKEYGNVFCREIIPNMISSICLNNALCVYSVVKLHDALPIFIQCNFVYFAGIHVMFELIVVLKMGQLTNRSSDLIRIWKYQHPKMSSSRTDNSRVKALTPVGFKLSSLGVTIKKQTSLITFMSVCKLIRHVLLIY
jgi:hypothetical protein